MTTANKPLYFWARIDHWIREAFENETSTVYRIVNDVIVVLIFFSIISVMLESVTSIYTPYQAYFDISEMVVVILFTIEYACNIYVAPKKTKYLFGPWGLIDFFAIAPSLLNIADFRFLKVLRVLRILRFLRMMRMLRLLKLTKTLAKDAEAEPMNKFQSLKMDLTIYFIALFSVLTVFSTLEYYCERAVESTQFTSIPRAMWWCIVTITTVGYGDMYPVTVLGRITAGAAMLCGVALFGLLMNVIGKYMMTTLFGSEVGGEVNAAELESEIRKAQEKK